MVPGSKGALLNIHYYYYYYGRMYGIDVESDQNQLQQLRCNLIHAEKIHKHRLFEHMLPKYRVII